MRSSAVVICLIVRAATTLAGESALAGTAAGPVTNVTSPVSNSSSINQLNISEPSVNSTTFGSSIVKRVVSGVSSLVKASPGPIVLGVIESAMWLASATMQGAIALHVMEIGESVIEGTESIPVVDMAMILGMVMSVIALDSYRGATLSLEYIAHKLVRLASIGPEMAVLVSLLRALEAKQGFLVLKLNQIAICGALALTASMIDPVTTPQRSIKDAVTVTGKRIVQLFGYVMGTILVVTLANPGDPELQLFSSTPFMLAAFAASVPALWVTRNDPSLL